jgi:hypothetical protein
LDFAIATGVVLVLLAPIKEYLKRNLVGSFGQGGVENDFFGGAMTEDGI